MKLKNSLGSPAPKQAWYGAGVLCATGCVLIIFYLFASFAFAAPEAVTLPNPLGEERFEVVVGRIIQTLLGGAGVLALLMVVYGGLQWLTAAGNPEKIKKGRDILLWSTLGLALMFGSYIIVRYILVALTTGTINP